MTLTWAQLRDGILRPLLKDPNKQVWSDSELMNYANFGLDHLSVHEPRTAQADYSIINGALWLHLNGVGAEVTATAPMSGCYQTPEDMHNLVRVVWVSTDAMYMVPSLGALDAFDQGSGLDFAQSHVDAEPLAYLADWPREGWLWLTRPLTSSTTLRLVYGARRKHIENADSVIDIGHHHWMREAVTCYTCYMAHLRQGVGRANLEQWAQKPDLDVGNPLNAEAREWYMAYKRLLNEARRR